MLDLVSQTDFMLVFVGVLLRYYLIKLLWQYFIRRFIRKNHYIISNILSLATSFVLVYLASSPQLYFDTLLNIIFCLCFIFYDSVEENYRPWFYFDRNDIKKLPAEQIKGFWRFFSGIDYLFLFFALLGLLATIFLGNPVMLILFSILAPKTVKKKEL